MRVISIKNYAHDLRVIIQLMQYHNKVRIFKYIYFHGIPVVPICMLSSLKTIDLHLFKYLVLDFYLEFHYYVSFKRWSPMKIPLPLTYFHGRPHSIKAR